MKTPSMARIHRSRNPAGEATDGRPIVGTQSPRTRRAKMKEFEPLIGEWHGEGEVPTEPPMKISVEERIERLGKFIVISSVGEPAEMPASVSIIGGARDGQ